MCRSPEKAEVPKWAHAECGGDKMAMLSMRMDEVFHQCIDRRGRRHPVIFDAVAEHGAIKSVQVQSERPSLAIDEVIRVSTPA